MLSASLCRPLSGEGLVCMASAAAAADCLCLGSTYVHTILSFYHVSVTTPFGHVSFTTVKWRRQWTAQYVHANKYKAITCPIHQLSVLSQRPLLTWLYVQCAHPTGYSLRFPFAMLLFRLEVSNFAAY